ncbi:transcriptional regulator BetI [Rhodococcus erythropolis]|uniref:TetR/AcrR family transcriptional regulator n=1 Tax=Rhodococcus erythropolis TaxID=1833 RepID=UPI000BB38F80|nr:TetR/AcrR family transcriptional regulator [Rhodococcus erythropolis]PBI91857.1 transcriptional regulator BetI [Rhodococcus erythropolis]
MSTNKLPAESLRDRKRRQARERIIEAAFSLFVERGFDVVTVDEIAQRAEIGRTTFFRYFGDKQEVVFSTEDDFLHALNAAMRDTPPEPIQDLTQALLTSRRLLLAICAEAARSPSQYALYHRLVKKYPELEDRHTRKTRHYADLLETHLIDHCAPPAMAVLAAQLTVACYQVAWRLGRHDATAVLREANDAFDRLLGATA